MPDFRHCYLILLLTLAVACSSDNELRPFTSDGCSLFPDSSPIAEEDWCACCFEHDLSYWRGGTAKEREAADKLLQECVFEKTNDESFARLMYEGVRVGGSPYFYNWYRWGYGWGYERKYQALSSEESKVADSLLDKYLSTTNAPVCQTD